MRTWSLEEIEREMDELDRMGYDLLELPDGQVLAFEWDEAKALENEKKHDVPFRIAMYVFADGYRIERYDDLHSTEEEDRWITIGCVPNAKGRILYVVYTERFRTDMGLSYRLISARKASPKEVALYHGQ